MGDGEGGLGWAGMVGEVDGLDWAGDDGWVGSALWEE